MRSKLIIPGLLFFAVYISACYDGIHTDCGPESLVKNGVANGFTDIVTPDLPYRRFSSNLNLKIDSVSKQVDSSLTFFKQHTKEVAAWELTAPQIKAIILACRELDAHEFHDNFGILPCSYTGQISIGSQRAFFELNAGAYCTITFKDKTIRLGYKRADAEKLFLSGPEEQ